MRVFVAGATGVLGARVLPLLVQARHEVTGISRTPAKADLVRAAGATPVTLDLFDPEELAGAVAGHDAVINIATHIPDLSKAMRASAWAEDYRIRTEGAHNLVQAALAGGASRYLQESVAFFYADAGSEWVDEDSPVDLPTYAQASRAAEAEAQRFTEAGGVGVVLRFGLFYGAGSSHTGSQLAMARRGLSPFLGGPDGYQTLLHLDDAATAVVAALRVPSGVYNVSEDEPATRRDLAHALGAALNRRPGRSLRGALRLGGARAAYLGRSLRVSNRRFRTASGWSPAYPTPALGWAQVVEAQAALGGGNRPE
jgi:nucleoside-diphosphate-sugar epimerase